MAEMQSTLVAPDIKDILTTGLQFGHSTSRWNPLMSKYIYANKNGIHIIDIVQTRELLQKAIDFLVDASSKGEVIFVGTKRQAAEIVKEQAVRAGAHFIINRWPGGMLTNYNMSQRSLGRLKELERLFEEGVEGRTKYEVSRMKVEWEHLTRLYGGVKNLGGKPVAVVIIDPKFERVAIRECRKMRIPVVALADTNCDPSMVDYIIPGNDDALKAIGMVTSLLADAVLQGNGGKGVQHQFKDYTESEVKLIKAEEVEAEREIVAEAEEQSKPVERISAQPKPQTKGDAGKGILERVKEQADAQASGEKVKAAKKKAAK